MVAIRKFLVTSLRFLATAGLLWALAARTDLGHAVQLMGQVVLPLLVATLVALGIASLIVAVRWHVILSAKTASPGPASLSKIVLVGLFFNQVLPTGVGGDAVRVLRCCKLGIGLGAAVRSILLDRACGYLVLMIVYAVSLPGLLRVLADPWQRWLVIAVLSGGLLGLIALVLFDFLPRPLAGLRLIAPLAELSRETRQLFTHPARCAAVLGLSVLTIGLTILAFKFIGDGVGGRLSLGSWIMIVPPVTLIQLLPISLAGWGVREVALVVALASFGVPSETALAISVLMGLSLIAIGLPGGVIWLLNWDIAKSNSTGFFAGRKIGSGGG